MRFCPTCNLVMRRDPSTGVVKFHCSCGYEEVGTPADARIEGKQLTSSETTEMYENLLKTAAHDRVNQLVHRLCKACGLDYMTQVRVGKAEAIIYKCKCGNQETPN